MLLRKQGWILLGLGRRTWRLLLAFLLAVIPVSLPVVLVPILCRQGPEVLRHNAEEVAGFIWIGVRAVLAIYLPVAFCIEYRVLLRRAEFAATFMGRARHQGTAVCLILRPFEVDGAVDVIRNT